MSDSLCPERACVVSQGWSEAEPLEIDRTLIISHERALFARWIKVRPSRAMESNDAMPMGYASLHPWLTKFDPSGRELNSNNK